MSVATLAVGEDRAVARRYGGVALAYAVVVFATLALAATLETNLHLNVVFLLALALPAVVAAGVHAHRNRGLLVSLLFTAGALFAYFAFSWGFVGYYPGPEGPGALLAALVGALALGVPTGALAFGVGVGVERLRGPVDR